jgi:hypothetical protein
MCRKLFAYLLTVVFVAGTARPLLAQSVGVVNEAEVWRSFAGRLEAGTPIKLRLRDGRTVKATFIEARDETMIVQPKSRVAVPVQPLAYVAIVGVERDDKPSQNVAKAIGIGVASGVGTFFGMLLLAMATLD